MLVRITAVLRVLGSSHADNRYKKFLHLSNKILSYIKDIYLFYTAVLESRIITLFCCCSIIFRSDNKSLEKEPKSSSRVCISNKTLQERNKQRHTYSVIFRFDEQHLIF